MNATQRQIVYFGKKIPPKNKKGFFSIFQFWILIIFKKRLFLVLGFD